jgi:hypothetical protein
MNFLLLVLPFCSAALLDPTRRLQYFFSSQIYVHTYIVILGFIHGNVCAVCTEPVSETKQSIEVGRPQRKPRGYFC